MPLTPNQVKDLESKRSRYGCGADTCLACNPIQYGCDDCAETFTRPIANGESYICEFCDYDNKEDY